MSKVYKKNNCMTSFSNVVFGGGGGRRKKKKTLNTRMSGPSAHSESLNTSKNPYRPISTDNSTMQNKADTVSKSKAVHDSAGRNCAQDIAVNTVGGAVIGSVSPDPGSTLVGATVGGVLGAYNSASCGKIF